MGPGMACSDEHYGSMWNLGPGPGASMGRDGWEPGVGAIGADWVILDLGNPRPHPATWKSITAHLKATTRIRYPSMPHAAQRRGCGSDQPMFFFGPELLGKPQLRTSGSPSFSYEHKCRYRTDFAHARQHSSGLAASAESDCSEGRAGIKIQGYDDIILRATAADGPTRSPRSAM